MDDIFDIKFPIEQEIKEKVIVKFSNKQGGAYNIFSYYWQCFVWAATIGYLRNEPRKLSTGIERIFSLNTMKANGGEKVAQALICMCIARSGSIDIMKNPSDAIQQISEFANGGFYHIMKLMENGENSFNDLEKVKQEIFSRNYDMDGVLQSAHETEKYVVPKDTHNKEEEQESITEDSDYEEEVIDEKSLRAEAEKPWEDFDIDRLNAYFERGMEISSIAERLGKSVYAVQYQLSLLGKIRMPLNVTVKNTILGGTVVNKSGEVLYTDEAPLKIFNDKIYRFNMKSACMTVKDIKRVEGEWIKGSKMLVAYPESDLYSKLSQSNFVDDIEDFVEGEKREANKIKVKGVWYDYYGDLLGSK